MNPFRLLFNLLRLPLDLLIWMVDFLRVTRFVFSANHKISDRCPFGCYKPENVVKAGLRKCPGAGRYGNFWVFQTLCKCARKPDKRIPGVPAYCRERGNFEISFSRWASISLVAFLTILGTVYAVSSGFISRQMEVASEIASPATLRALRDVAKPREIAIPRRPTPTVKGKPEFRVDEQAVATSEVSLRTTIKQALTTPEDLGVRVRLARGYFTLGMAADAKALLADCLRENADYAPAIEFLVLYALVDQDVALAKSILTQAVGGQEVPAGLVPAAMLVAHAAGDATAVAALSKRIDPAENPLGALALAVVESQSLDAQQYLAMARGFPDLTGLLRELLVVGPEIITLERLQKVAADETLAGDLRGVAVEALWQRGKRSQARELAEAVVRRSPDAVGAQVVRMEVLLAADAPRPAIALARAALPLASSPQDAVPLRKRLAQTLEKEGDAAAALREWQLVREAGPDADADAAIAKLRGKQ